MGWGALGERKEKGVICISFCFFPVFSLIMRKTEVEAKGEMNRNVPQKWDNTPEDELMFVPFLSCAANLNLVVPIACIKTYLRRE